MTAQQELTEVRQQLQQAREQIKSATGDRREYLRGRIDGLSVMEAELMGR